MKPKVSKDVDYWLGRVDHLNYNFDEAIAHYQAYNATLKKNDQRKEELAQLIQHSKNAKVLFASPKDIFVKNLQNRILHPISAESYARLAISGMLRRRAFVNRVLKKREPRFMPETMSEKNR